MGQLSEINAKPSEVISGIFNFGKSFEANFQETKNIFKIPSRFKYAETRNFFWEGGESGGGGISETRDVLIFFLSVLKNASARLTHRKERFLTSG